ncbi:hypothetical protein G9A89_000634, partial [Geosiphon pyriformis]
MSIFVVIESVGSAVSGLSSSSVSLGTCLSAKKKQVDSVYSCSVFHKKPKKLNTSIDIVNSSAGLLSLKIIDMLGTNLVVSWGSKVGSKASSVSGLSDVKNIKNIVAEKTSYADSNVLIGNKNMDNMTPQKTCTWIYVLKHPPKALSFKNL